MRSDGRGIAAAALQPAALSAAPSLRVPEGTGGRHA